MEDFLSWTAIRLIQALKTGDLSVSELMSATLAQIGSVNPASNAIVSLRDPDALMAEAMACEEAGVHAPLAGIPIAIKDLSDAEGFPTSQGSAISAGQIASSDDLMVARLKQAGAIVIGKTNTPEFGLGSHTTNKVFGPTQNAIVPGRSAGGSSGGAAVALARHMTCLADGSDMMGSLRNPAGWNGVYGLRPTWGRIPSNLEADLFLHQLSTQGPMARSPGDLALLLEVQAGPTAGHPFGMAAELFQNDLSQPVSGRRLAWLADWGAAYAMEDGLLEDTELALSAFEEAGCIVEAVAPPFSAAAIWDAWTTLRSWAVAGNLGAYYDDKATRHMLKPEAIWEIERGRAVSGADIQRASAIRSDWYRAAHALFDRYDAFVLPTAQCFPFPIDWDWPRNIGATEMDTYHRWMEIVIPVSLIGLPCVAVPIAGERPMGLQVAGRRGNDRGVLQLAQAWHVVNGL